MHQGFPGIGHQGAQDSDSEHRKQNVSPIIIPDCCLQRVFRLQQRGRIHSEPSSLLGRRDEVGSLARLRQLD